MLKFCRKCQVETDRYTNGDCKECAKARASSYRAANPEKTKASVDAWKIANPEKIKIGKSSYYERNKQKVKLDASIWYSRNSAAAKSRSVVWRKNNPERKKNTDLAWHKAHPDAMKVISQNRRAQKKSSGGKLSIGISEKLFKLQKGKCACCGEPLGEKYHLDHKMPLALGGGHTDENMQLLKQKCNSQKGKKHPIDFMQSRGFLL